MTGLNHNHFLKKLGGVITALFLIIAVTAQAAAADKVTTHKDAKGWKLKVNGKDFHVKGMVWGYTPKDENYTYNLWAKPEPMIRSILDYDFSRMQKANVNAIRSFATIPPKWVTYVYKKYGIMTAINPLMGRYGITVGGKWQANTDYSDPATRKVLKAETLKDIHKYKNVPGVLMFALGNESNYGLSWKSFEIENLPEGEQHKARAEFLYSLFNEVITEGKKIDPNHPFTIVNGDLQYLDIIAKYSKNWDLLGVNSYRGISFTDLWKKAKAKIDIPIALFEFGSDAFNALKFSEDEVSQATYLHGQWGEMYRKSYGHGEEGNSIGGFVFEWRDEWWKFKQDQNLDRQDRNASWSNGGYQFDFKHPNNNMNEEWWGINRLGKVNQDGVQTAVPRMAVDVLREVWRIDPFTASRASVARAIKNIDMKGLAAKSEVRRRQFVGRQSEKFKVSGGSVKGEVLTTRRGNNDTNVSQGMSAFLDVEFQTSKNLYGDFSLNVMADAVDSDFEVRYGDRLEDEDLITGGDHIELYDFNVVYETDRFELHGFYHVPRYHWGYKGDFFGLLREATDMEGQDIWNAKAPFGVEFIGKKKLDGLNVVLGPEVYWGANPKGILKYQFGKDKRYTFMHSEDISVNSDSSAGGAANTRLDRQTTLQAKFEPRPGMEFQIGGIISGTNKIGDKYDKLEHGNVIESKIEFADTLGMKALLSWEAAENTNAYVGLQYAGIVADAGDPLRENGTQLPYSGLGNKREFELGFLMRKGDYTISPRLLYRDNLLDANPLIKPASTSTILTPGIEVRNTDNDPFAVLDNRAARSAEIYLTYDPTPFKCCLQLSNVFRSLKF